MNELSVAEKEITILELLDRLLEKGIVIHGDLMISVANVDLIYVGLRVIITAAETLKKHFEE